MILRNFIEFFFFLHFVPHYHFTPLHCMFHSFTFILQLLLNYFAHTTFDKLMKILEEYI